MMMTQWGHAQPEAGVRTKHVVRTAMRIALLWLAMGFAWMGTSPQANAETYTPHARRVTQRYATAHFVTHHAKASKATASSRLTNRRRPAHGQSPRLEPVRSSVSTRRMSARERRSAHYQTVAASSVRQLSSRRHHGLRRHRSDVPEVVAQAPAKEMRHANSSADAKLTANDFARVAGAQSGAASGVYASGIAQPDEDVDSVGPATPRVAARSIVTASAEAATPPPQPTPLQRSAPSDLVGAPLTATVRPQPRTTTTDTNISSVSHAELAEAAGQPVVLPGLYRYGRLVVPPPMRGTREILVHQNLIADEEGLSRIQDDNDLRRMRSERMLVDFPASESLHVNPELAVDRRCARPWAVRFAADMAKSYYAHFHQPLQINSAVRTVDYQIRLRRVNGNAAGIGGETGSPHLTGEAIDFGKRDMSQAQIAWMRTYLRPLMQVGKVDVEEEFQQACFHISVYRSYAPDLPNPRRIARRDYAELQSPHATRQHVDVDQ